MEGTGVNNPAWNPKDNTERDTTHDYTNELTARNTDATGKETPLTWLQLKDLCNTLTSEQLQLPVIAWGDNFSIPVHVVCEITQDLINPSGDGVEPVSAYVGPDRLDDSYDEDHFADEPVVVYKGELRLECGV